VPQALQEQTVRQEHKGQLEFKAPQALQEQTVRQEHKGQLEFKAPLDVQAQQVHKAPLDFQVLLEIKDFRAIQALLGHKERRA
jgi:hypothetical protein